jgi:hypothetical protein
LAVRFGHRKNCFSDHKKIRRSYIQAGAKQGRKLLCGKGGGTVCIKVQLAGSRIEDNSVICVPCSGPQPESASGKRAKRQVNVVRIADVTLKRLLLVAGRIAA